MHYPLSSGQSARLLNTTEPHLNELIRKGRIRPEPAIAAGRRQWRAEHLLQAAELLGVLTDELRQAILPDAAATPTKEVRP